MTGTSTLALLIGTPVWITLHIRDGAFYWTPIALMLILWVINGLGITVGYHRLATHESFKTHQWMEKLLYSCGAMAAQGAVWKWIADHLTHHMFSDKKGDPHSPNDGFFWSHWGWTIPYASPFRAGYEKKLNQNQAIQWVSKYNAIWVFGPFVLCFLITGCESLFLARWDSLLSMGWDGVLWGGFIRLGFTYHITWSVNSVCHKWGSQPYPTGDRSRNNFIVAFFGFGEGWHNNHHAFNWSARQGLEWWEIDLSWYLIWLLQKLHLAWDVGVPTKEGKEARKLVPVAV